MVGRGVLVGVGVVGAVGLEMWQKTPLCSPLWVALLSSTYGRRKKTARQSSLDWPQVHDETLDDVLYKERTDFLSCGTLAGRVQAKFVRTRG